MLLREAMPIKRAEVNQWLTSMTTAMELVVEQCGELRKQLPSQAVVPPPVAIVKPTPAPKPAAKTPATPASRAKIISKPRPTPAPAPLTAASSFKDPPAPEDQSQAKASLLRWRDSGARCNELKRDMGAVVAKVALTKGASVGLLRCQLIVLQLG